ncbi:MAG TPA: Pvc16 family protein [Sphingomonas sp.]|nr:Pvc16 family protein [Sphingomonas sp.]
MNSSFSIAACTVAIADRLHMFIGDAVPGARVTTLNPGSDALRTGDPFVNLYLFRTTRNGFVSNNDLPTRGPLGAAKNSPVLKLDLDYMITFFGDDARLDPQRLLGLVAGGLNAEPYVPRDMLRSAVATTPWLAGGGDQELPREEIVVTPLNMAPDAMARLWSEFVNVPYQLTQLYTATPIAIEYKLPVEPVLPVRRIGLRAVPSRAIAITNVVNAADPDLPIVGGGTLAVRIPDPAQPGLSVLLNGVAAKDVTSGFDGQGYAALLLPLTSAQPAPLATGALTVKVVKYGPDGKAIEAESPAFAANIVPGFAAPPAVSADGKQLDFTLALPVAAQAHAVALLYARGVKSTSYKLRCQPRADAGTALAAPLANVSAGEYLVSIEIEGVASLLDWKDGLYTGPLVKVGGTT